MKTALLHTLICCLLLLASHPQAHAQSAPGHTRPQPEKLGRGLIAVRKSEQTNFVSWRYLNTDPVNVAFNLYRNGEKLNATPLTQATCHEDTALHHTDAHYTLRTVINGKELPHHQATYTLPANAPVGYLNIALDVPQGGTTPDGKPYTYAPNDASIGDVDGDGEYEIILKWDPTNAKDNAHDGYTGSVLFDCYRLDGTKLWRINLGRNIRAGAHYTQFMVFDLDQDGRAELVMKTADGTVDGKGNTIGNPDEDHRSPNGRILTGNEYLTVFSGLTGEALYTTTYAPPRGNPKDWGDERANRSDRHLACVAYLDGKHPSVVMCRGYYTRTVLAAYDWDGHQLTPRWTFDTDHPRWTHYAGQGNHNLRVGDVDGDGCDEIVYGSCTIDHDGTGLYNTRMGHGDALHLTVFDPTREGMQVWDCHENKRDGSTFRDAATGEVIFQLPAPTDVGRCMAADIDPRHAGVEMWSTASGGIRNVKGQVTDSLTRIPVNMACWWDGDLLRELLDQNKITKYNAAHRTLTTLLVAEGATSNNGSKSTPCLQGDITGDWREELLLRTADNKNLRLYISTHNTHYRFHTFAHDPVYRISMATQNVGYNQPTQTGFYFGADLGKCFAEKEITTTHDSITLDAGMHYDTYQWSTGCTTRSCTIKAHEAKANGQLRVELKVGFRGHTFADHIDLIFAPKQRE